MKEFQPVAEVEEFQPVAEIEESRNEKISAYQKKPSFWDRKITPLLQEVGLSPTTEEIQAQAQNVYSEASDEAEKNVNRILVDESRKLSQEYNIPMRDVFKELSKKKDEVKTDLTVEMMPQIEKNWDDFVYQKYGKLTPRKANERMLGVLSSAGLAVTAAELSPLIPIVLKSQAARETIGKVVTGIGTYMVGNEVGLKRILYPAIDFIEKKIQNRPWYYKRIKNVRELLPEEHTQAAEDIVNLTEIIGLGAISAKFAQKSPAILRKLTKDTFTSYKLPSKLYVTPQDLRNMPEGELRQFMGDIGITGDKEGQAQRVASFLKQGGEVSFPSEKIVTLVDKPYWAKIKGVFRISPFKQVSVSKIPLTTKITPTVFLPEKAGGAVTPSSPMTPDALRLIVEQSGGIWKGIGKGLPAEGEFPATPDLVYFDDPVTKSTMTMPINKVTPEEVKTHLAESRKKFTGVLKKPDEALQHKLSSTKDIKETAKAVDMDGNELVDMDGTPMEVNSDGTITLYHRTNLEGATKINKTGNFVSKENTNETFFSNKIEGQAEGYGDEIIAVKVKPSDVRINDAFHGGEIHVAISNKKLSKSSLFKLSSTVAKGGEISFDYDITGKKNNFKIDNTGKEGLGIKAIEKNRKIIQEKLIEIIELEKTDKIKFEAKMREAIDLAKKSNDTLKLFEKEYGAYRQPYDIDAMKRKITGGMRENQLEYSKTLPVLEDSSDTIKVYRGIKDKSSGNIVAGDFVSIDKEYAKEFGENIIEAVISKRDLRLVSSTKEMIYNPSKLSSTVAKGGEIKIGANIVYKTESGKEQSGIIDNIFQGTIYAKADGATTSFPITEKQIVKVIPQIIETLPQLVEEKVSPQPTPVPVIKRKLAEVKKVSGGTAVLIPDKKELLEEIQKAWKAAPTSEEYNPEVHKTVSFKIDGGANILNNQEALSKFFQIVRLAPEKVSVSASMPRSKSVSSLAHQEKIDKLINVPKEKGYWTDKKIAVKGEIKGEVGNTVLMNDMDKMIQKEFTSETKPAKLLYYSLESPDVTGVSPTPIPYSKSEGEIIPKAIFKAGDLYYGYDQFRLNVITKRFPAASYGINKDGTLIAYQDKKPVAMLLPFEEYRVVKTPPQFKKAKELGLIEGKANFPKSPSGNAMAGFWGGKKIPVEMGEFVYKLKPMEFPEIVELAKDLMGKYPELKTFTSLAGKFYGVGSAMRIKLHSDLFKRGNEQELAITLAHELGHLVDYLPDYTLKRGNILGRLLSLHKFMKHTFNLMINKEFKTELLRVTQYLHPFDENTVSKRYASYRKSSRELYAEAISLLVNSPGTMEKLAPNFTKAFFDNLDKKLDVKEAYFGLQRLLNGERADLLEHRWRNIQDMFTKGEVRRLEIEAEAKVRRTSSWSIVRQFLDVKTAPLEQRMRQIEKSGKLISPEKNPLYKLEQEDLAQSYIQNQFIQNIDIPILQVLIKNDITLNQFGSYLFLKRVAGKLDIVSDEIQDFIDDEDVDIIQECLLEYTDRKDLANPLGLNSESANELLEFMRNILGDKFNIIEEMGQLFKKFLLSQEEKAALNGRYNLNTFEKIVRPNNDYYVAFGVNDYLQRGVTASIVKQKGTLKGIENPLVTTLLKLVSLMRDNIRQEAKVSALNFFKENMPEEFKTKRQVGYEGEFNIYENGKLVTYYVDKYLAKTFEFSSEGDLALAMVINKWLGNQFFKDLFVTYNAQFSLWFNPIKDFKETYVALKPFLLQKGHNLTVQELLIAWFKSIPSSHLRQKGIYDNVIQDMMNNFALNTPVIEFDLNAKDETHKFIMDKFNINTMTMEGHKKLLRFLLTPVIKLMRGIKFAGSIFEVNSKITSWKLLKKYGFGDIEAAHITKRYPGTPDYREKGLLGNTSNAIVFYYNVRKSGIKRAIELGTNPKTRAGYWWAVFEMDIIPTILRIMAELGILGVVLKKFYDKQSEYTKTNYETFPLGFSVNGKPIGIQIPHGFAGGLASAILRKMVMSLKGKSKQLEQIFALPYQELPGLAPVIDIAIKNFQYMSGQNPRDDFYGQNILTDREQKARGWIGLKRMIKWTISKTGLIRMNNYNTEDSTVMESIMRINPLTNRILKIAEKTDIDVEAEKMKEEMIVREQKELRILIPIKEDFIKSGLIPIEYTKTPAFQKVKNNLRNIYGDDWTPEREMSLTTRIQNIFNDPRTQELWAMQNYRKSQTIEQKKYWLGRAMQAKKDVIKKKLGSFPKSVR